MDREGLASMMNCPQREVLEQIVGEGEADVPSEILEHLEGCSKCQDVMIATNRLLQTAAVTVTLGHRESGFDLIGARQTEPQAATTRLDSRPLWGHWWPPLISIFATAVVTLMFVFPWQFQRGGGRGGGIDIVPSADDRHCLLSLHSGLTPQPGVTTQSPQTDRSPLTPRSVVVTVRDRDWVFMTRWHPQQTSASRGQWREASRDFPAVWFISAPASDVTEEWFVMLSVSANTSEAKRERLVEILRKVIVDDHDEIEKCTERESLGELSKKWTKRVNQQSLETSVDVQLARWTVLD